MLKLTRKNSDTPNIQNYDDARMFRYANGGFSGITKDYGEELAGSDAGSYIFHIGTGEITHQGWQVEISSAGFDIQLDNISTLEYYTIYLEINLLISSSQTASILSLKGTSSYPTVSAGDDLTTTNTGTSRLVLFKVKLENGVMSIERQIDVLPYLKDNLIIENGKFVTKDSMYARYTDENHTNKTIEQRLTELGFNQGSCVLNWNIISTNGYSGTPSINSLIKQGQMVSFRLMIPSCNLTFQRQGGVITGYDKLTITIPEAFRPKGWWSVSLTIGAFVPYSGEATDLEGHSIPYSGEVGPITLVYRQIVGPDGVIEIDSNTIRGENDSDYAIYQKYLCGGCRWVHIFAGWGLTLPTIDFVYQTNNDSSPTRMRMIIRIGATKLNNISSIQFLYKLTEDLSNTGWTSISTTTVYDSIAGLFETVYEDTYYAVNIFDFSSIKPKVVKAKIIYTDNSYQESNLLVLPWRV